MSTAGPNTVSVHALPLEVLEEVLLLLPDVEDRANSMLVSRHFYAAATASRRLWRDVSVYGGGMTSLQRLTVRHGGLGIERLRWYVGSRPMSYSPFALRDQWELDQLWQSFRATALAASGSLRSLSLQHMPDELAEHCLPLLSHLSELEVDWRGTKPELRLANHGLGTFSELQSLSLRCSLLGGTPSRPVLASLPPVLRQLSLSSLSLAELPAGITTVAASLRHLHLERCYFIPHQAAWAALSRLTALTSLGLVECEWPRGFALPAEVSALRQLEELYIIDSRALIDELLWWDDDVLEPPTDDEAFAPLAGLPALSSLTLSMPHLQRLPAAALQLPSLRVLHLAGGSAGLTEFDMPVRAPSLDSPALAQLLLLSIEERFAVCDGAALVHATSLTRLELSTAMEQAVVEDDSRVIFDVYESLTDPAGDFGFQHVCYFLQVLAWLPALKVLHYLEPRAPSLVPMLIRESPECQQALEDLRAVRPCFAEALFDDAPV